MGDRLDQPGLALVPSPVIVAMSSLNPEWDALLVSPPEFQMLTGIEFQKAQDLCRATYTDRGLPKRLRWSHRLLKYVWNGLWFSIIWAICLGILVVPIAAGGFYVLKLLGWVAGFHFSTVFKATVGLCLLTGIPMSIWFSRDEEKKEEALRSLLPLTREVEKFNRLVRAADVKDRLRDATGQSLAIEERSQTLATLTQLRSQIENALKVERILRENQDVVAAQVDQFEGATVGNYAQLMTDRALDYEQVLDQALQVGDRVRSELQTLRNRHEP
jgi:hypothetical protein